MMDQLHQKVTTSTTSSSSSTSTNTTKETTSFSSTSCSSSVSSTSTTSTSPLSTPSSPISLGLDRSCPKSVTSLPSHVVRLDHYQIGAIRNRCLESSSNSTSCRDDNFEWYDLDAIGEHQEYSTSNARAGLVFTTKQQLLRKQARANRFVDPFIMETIDTSDGPAFELDKFVISWISNIAGNNINNNNNNNNNYNSNDSASQTSQTTQTDRELDDQIKSLEQELNMNGDDDSSSLGVSFSSLSKSF